MTTEIGRRRGRKLPVVFAVTTLLVGCGGSTTPAATVAPAATATAASATVAASTASVASPTTSATPSTAGDLTWTAADASSFGSAHIADVIATPTGFLAVGRIQENGHINGGIWTSTDGTTWARITVEAPDTAYLAVVSMGSTFVALSVHCDQTGGECDAPWSWTSPDAKTWTHHEIPECCLLNDLAASTTRVVAVGADVSTGYPQTPTDVGAFTSTDGATWTRSTGDDSFKQASMGAVGALSSGFATLGNGQTSMLAWTSTDGTKWVTAPDSDALKTAQASDMATMSSGVVAVGRDGSGAVSWTSADGKAWTKSAAGTDTDGGAMNKVTLAGGWIVAVGHDSSFKSAIWSSTDGLAWSAQASLPGGANDLTGVAGNDHQVVAFGSTPSGAAVLLVATL